MTVSKQWQLVNKVCTSCTVLSVITLPEMRLNLVLLLTSLTDFLKSNHSQKLHPEITLQCVIPYLEPKYSWSNSSQSTEQVNFIPVSEMNLCL